MYPASDYVYNISKDFNYGTAAHPFGMNASAHTDLSPPSQVYPSGGPVVHWHDNGFATMGQQQQGSEGWPNNYFFETVTQHYNTSFDDTPRYQASIPTLLRHLSEFYEQDARASSIRAQGRNKVLAQTSLPPGSSMDLSRPVRCSDVTVPPLSEPAWPIDETLDALNKNLADIFARPPPLSTSHTSTSTLAPAQHLLHQQDDVGYQHGSMAFNDSHAIDIAEIMVHLETSDQHFRFDHDVTIGQTTSSESRLVELEQARVYNHGQSPSGQYSVQSGFKPYKSESGLDQALVEVPSSALAASPQPAAIASFQNSQERYQPHGGGFSLDMALVESPSPTSTVAPTPATAPTSTSTSHAPSIQSAPASMVHAQPAIIPTSTSTNNAPSSQSVAVPALKRKSRTDEDSNTAASAPSSSTPRKKRKPTPSSTKPREPPRPRYFPCTSSYRRIESQPPATTPEYGEHYQRLPRDPNASVYDMLGIPTSVGRPGSRHGPFTPGRKEDSRRS